MWSHNSASKLLFIVFGIVVLTTIGIAVAVYIYTSQVLHFFLQYNDLADRALSSQTEPIAQTKSEMAALGNALENSLGMLGSISILLAFITLAALSICAFLFALPYFNCIRKITKSACELAEGKNSDLLHGIKRTDQLGQLSEALCTIASQLEDHKAFRSKAEEEASRQLELYKTTENAVESFRASAKTITSVMDDKSAEMQSAAADLEFVAIDAQQQAQDAESAAAETSQSMQTVAAASEQLSASIGAIDAQVMQTTDIVSLVNEKMENSIEEVTGLSAASQQIDMVIGLINDIAEQTNLLALNATIEAARAGEAGKGFSVVASEVKQLAEQTKKATEDISEHIQGIQSSTKRTTERIHEVAEVNNRLNEVTSAIAEAIREQGSSTDEISRTTTNVSSAIQRLAESVGKTASAISAAGDTAQTVLVSSEAIAGENIQMNQVVETFYVTLREGQFDRRREASVLYTGKERRASMMEPSNDEPDYEDYSFDAA